MHRSFRRVPSLLIVLPLLTAAAPAAVTISRDHPARSMRLDAPLKATTVYDHGDPSDMEQYLLELVNRGRANPQAEALIFLNSNDEYIQNSLENFNVDRQEVIADFSGYAAQPPLAFNGQLAQAALAHSRDMATYDYQGHVDHDGTTLGERLDAVDYDYSRAGENVFAYAQNMIHTQAAFLIDWGVPDLGHRKNLLNLGEYTNFREVGLSVFSENDPRTSVGPWVVTQEFGLGDPTIVFVTGVAYRDEDGNGMYSEGEGLAGVEIQPETGDYYAVTSSSGGYAVPIDQDHGVLTVHAYRSDLPDRQTVILVEAANRKLDFVYGSVNLGRISGVVTDGAGQGVEDVTIRLEPGSLQLLTDGRGEFLFTDLGAGVYTLHAERENYTVYPNDFTISVKFGEEFATTLTATLQGPEPPSSGGEDPPTDPNASEDPITPAAPCTMVMAVLLAGLWLGIGALRAR